MDQGHASKLLAHRSLRRGHGFGTRIDDQPLAMDIRNAAHKQALKTMDWSDGRPRARSDRGTRESGETRSPPRAQLFSLFAVKRGGLGGHSCEAAMRLTL